MRVSASTPLSDLTLEVLKFGDAPGMSLPVALVPAADALLRLTALLSELGELLLSQLRHLCRLALHLLPEPSRPCLQHTEYRIRIEEVWLGALKPAQCSIGRARHQLGLLQHPGRIAVLRREIVQLRELAHFGAELVGTAGIRQRKAIEPQREPSLVHRTPYQSIGDGNLTERGISEEWKEGERASSLVRP